MSGFQRAQTIYDAISGRRSIRQYSSDDVSKDTVRRLISMAVMAPSAHNRQPWPFVVARAESGRGERDSVFRVRTGGRPTVAWKILGTARRE
jgi:nitroreductase